MSLPIPSVTATIKGNGCCLGKGSSVVYNEQSRGFEIKNSGGIFCCVCDGARVRGQVANENVCEAFAQGLLKDYGVSLDVALNALHIDRRELGTEFPAKLFYRITHYAERQSRKKSLSSDHLSPLDPKESKRKQSLFVACDEARVNGEILHEMTAVMRKVAQKGISLRGFRQVLRDVMVQSGGRSALNPIRVKAANRESVIDDEYLNIRQVEELLQQMESLGPHEVSFKIYDQMVLDYVEKLRHQRQAITCDEVILTQELLGKMLPVMRSSAQGGITLGALYGIATDMLVHLGGTAECNYQLIHREINKPVPNDDLLLTSEEAEEVIQRVEGLALSGFVTLRLFHQVASDVVGGISVRRSLNRSNMTNDCVDGEEGLNDIFE